MTSGDGEPTREQQPITPEVSTAPPPAHARSRWAAIPAHLGRARTSTLVLTALFLAVGALYLQVKPETTGAGTSPANTKTRRTHSGTAAPPGQRPRTARAVNGTA